MSMLRKCLAALSLFLAVAFVLAGNAAAQGTEAFRERANQGTVSIISGGVGGTYVRIASDLAAVLDRPDQLRILPILGRGSLQNLADLLYMRGIDVAIVQSDVLRYVRQQQLEPNIERRLRYITKLYNEEVHVLARAEVADLAALAGRKVNVDIVGSGTSMTAATLFQLLGIAVEATHFDQALALEKLKAGEIDAMLYVAGKPAELFRAIDGASGLKFLAVPMRAELLETYLPSTLENRDYPRLLPDGSAPVETVAVGAVMAVSNWEPNTDRYRRIAMFVDAFFNSFDQFLKPPRHAKWQEVNLAATLPGWSRFGAAESWLARETAPAAAAVATNPALRTSFEAFLRFMDQAGLRPAGDRPLTTAEREALFARFMEWKKAKP
jgi:TRAP transporter TAXI family solute receptor